MNKASELARLFSGESFRFQMGLRRSANQPFFGNGNSDGSLLRERQHWLQSSPHDYTAMLPEGMALLDEAIAFAKAAGVAAEIEKAEPPFDRCVELGKSWEPDFLLLNREGAEFRLRGGCVCFPSFWTLAEKIGHPVDFIHSAAPTLNATIGPQIQVFLQRLKPGEVWERSNWGLAATCDLNCHPNRNLPRLQAGVKLHDVWLRVEDQAFVILPETQGLLFGIRVSVDRVGDLVAQPDFRSGLLRFLETMPHDVSRYKGIENPREGLLAQLYGCD
jgi:dimethylamine monooxygenase subunit A